MSSYGMVSRASRAMALAATLVLAGCAPDAATLARAGVDPVGNYEFTMMDDGEAITGGMEVTGSPGAYGGRIFADGRPEGSISTVTTGGKQMVVTADFPGMVLLARVEFNGEAFTGDWSMRGEGGSVEGRRVTP